MVLTRWLHSRPAGEALPEEPPLAVDDIRRQVLAALQDCGGAGTTRVRYQLEHARSAQELWLLRGEVYQQVAREHCESQAAQRMAALLPAFTGSLPARSLRGFQPAH